MGTMKNYLLTLLQQCSEEKTGQDAIEHAIVTGALKLTYNFQTDIHQIFDQRSSCCDAPVLADGHHSKCRQCNQPATFATRYDEFIEVYQRKCREQGDALVQLYHASGLMEEILRPVSLAQCIPENERVGV